MQLPIKYSQATRDQRRAARRLYAKKQGQKCLYCKGALWADPPAWVQSKWINEALFPKNFFAYPVHLHHDHKTDLTLGTVHAYCNAVLWQYHGE